MHVAFPSSEIFRCLSVRQDLLRGLLGADLVGFQTANYARHFRQTVSRILAYEALPKGIQEWMHLLKQRYAGMKIVAGRDKLDEIQEALSIWEDLHNHDHANRANFCDFVPQPLCPGSYRTRPRRHHRRPHF